MTRISAGIRDKQMCDIHVRKERLEIIRIPNTIKKRLEEGKPINLKNLPEDFVLGTGHVRFFYNKLAYLHKRYLELTAEAIRRKTDVTDYEDSFKGLPPELYNDWEETPIARQLCQERITERLNGMLEKNLKYYGEQKTAEQLIEILKQ